MKAPGEPRSKPVTPKRVVPKDGRKVLPLFLTFPNELVQSWNKVYAGGNWRLRHRIAADAHDVVKFNLLEQGIEPVPYIVPVTLTMRCYFKGQQMDCSNLPAKLYEDGLVKYGLLIDDNPEWVVSVTLISLKDKDNPRVEIDLIPVR